MRKRAAQVNTAIPNNAVRSLSSALDNRYVQYLIDGPGQEINWEPGRYGTLGEPFIRVYCIPETVTLTKKKFWPSSQIAEVRPSYVLVAFNTYHRGISQDGSNVPKQRGPIVSGVCCGIFIKICGSSIKWLVSARFDIGVLCTTQFQRLQIGYDYALKQSCTIPWGQQTEPCKSQLLHSFDLTIDVYFHWSIFILIIT